MIENILRIIIRFIVLVLLQVLILNNIQFGGYANPYLYILFILLLPIEISGWLLLLLSFLLGLSVDLFSNTMGIHAAASVFAAFCRPFVLKVIAPRDGYEADKLPTLQNLGLSWFLAYSITITILHHIALFYLEVFRLSEFFSTLFRVLVSSLLTIILMLITQYLFYNQKTTRE